MSADAAAPFAKPTVPRPPLCQHPSESLRSPEVPRPQSLRAEFRLPTASHSCPRLPAVASFSPTLPKLPVEPPAPPAPPAVPRPQPFQKPKEPSSPLTVPQPQLSPWLLPTAVRPSVASGSAAFQEQMHSCRASPVSPSTPSSTRERRAGFSRSPSASKRRFLQTPRSVADDGTDSEDSADQGAIILSPRRFAAVGDWMLQQAPIFFCGAVAAWISLVFLWRWDGDTLHAENAAARVLIAELRHMGDVLRAELGEARRLLKEVENAKAGREPGRMWSTPASYRPGSDHSPVHVSAAALGFSTQDASSSEHAAAIGDHTLLGSMFFQVLSRLILFFVDGGLVYFCLRQCTSQENKAYLESVFIMVLERFGVRLWLRDFTEKPAADAAAGFRTSQPRPAVTSSSESMPRVETAGIDALLVRRRDASDLAPVQKQQLLRQAEHLRDLRQRRSFFAMSAASAVGVTGARVLVLAAPAVGGRFLTHVVMYAVLTVRVCLIVLLVLF